MTIAFSFARRLNLFTQRISSAQGNGARKLVGYWMLGTSVSVLGIIAVGGLTRLTESGLSMVDWRLVHFKAPSTEQEWQEYFEKYKQSPEYRMNNQGMHVEEYKRIYWWEHGHRVYGRLLGLAVILPTVFFSLRPGWASSRIKAIMWGSSGLVLFQGLLGWYMVKSGLDEETVKRQQAARVSSYRLASHLGSAVALYSTLFMTGLGIVSTGKPLDLPQKASRVLKRGAHSISGMILLTMLTGAFVAGLDAGMVYNTFPKMGDRWIPSDLVDGKKGLVRNVAENPTAAQFTHRLLAISTISSITAYWWWTRMLRERLPKRVKAALDALLLIGWGQGALGVATLWYSVPVPLGSAHQCGSMAALTSSLYLMSLLRPI